MVLWTASRSSRAHYFEGFMIKVAIMISDQIKRWRPERWLCSAIARFVALWSMGAEFY